MIRSDAKSDETVWYWQGFKHVDGSLGDMLQDPVGSVESSGATSNDGDPEGLCSPVRGDGGVVLRGSDSGGGGESPERKRRMHGPGAGGVTDSGAGDERESHQHAR